MKVENEYVYVLPTGDSTELTKLQCRDYLDKLERCPVKTFSELFSFADSIRMVKLNFNCWKNSQCNCSSWQKNYTCFHVPYVACKETQCDFSFNEIILSIIFL